MRFSKDTKNQAEQLTRLLPERYNNAQDFRQIAYMIKMAKEHHSLKMHRFSGSPMGRVRLSRERNIEERVQHIASSLGLCAGFSGDVRLSTVSVHGYGFLGGYKIGRIRRNS